MSIQERQIIKPEDADYQALWDMRVASHPARILIGVLASVFIILSSLYIVIYSEAESLIPFIILGIGLFLWCVNYLFGKCLSYYLRTQGARNTAN